MFLSFSNVSFLFLSGLFFSCSRPIAVFHWNAKEAALVRKSRSVAKTSYGYPKHKWYSYVVCFNKSCITKAEWKNHQKHNRFKGFKNNKPPKKTPTMPQPDTLIAQQTENPKEKPIILHDILFKSNRADLQQSFSPQLDSLANVLKLHPEWNVTITGHTDDSGNETKNQQLSQERAKSTANYLIAKGISESRIAYTGMGSAQPLTSNATEEGRKQNRRVEILLHH